MPHLSGPCRYFFHHSNRVLSLQCYPSLVGKTGGTRIDRYRHLVMPPRFVRRLRNNMAQSLVLHTQGIPHVKNKRTCVCVIRGSAVLACVLRKLGAYLGVRLANAHFEYTHSVYKHALNRFSDKATPSAIIHYSLLIINFNCGSCSVFEVAQSVYKFAQNEKVRLVIAQM